MFHTSSSQSTRSLQMPVDMPPACRSWEMNLGLSIGREPDGQGNNWMCAEKSNCMAHPGVFALTLGLPSQPATDACLENDRLQHGISCTRHGSTPSDSLMQSKVAHNLARQEGQNDSFPDLVRSASKGSFSRESSRSSFWSPYSSTLSVVSEDQPWDSSSSMYDNRFQDERSSLSSLSSSEESSSCSLEDASEVQSSYKGPLANMYSLEEALPRKRGLSGFFAGKSRSFSCLADVTSVEDLVKPENPYSKKRKFVSAYIGNADRLRMHPKKSLHISKHASAFSGAPRGNMEGELTCSSRTLKTPRSYSLSDLQGAGSQCSPE